MTPGYKAKLARYRDAYATDWRHRIKRLFFNARDRARRKGIPFTVTLDELLQQLAENRFRCARTGIRFRLDQGDGASPWVPSLDRIEPAAGYVTGNVQIVCVIYNLAKNKATDADVLTMAQRLVERHNAVQGEDE